MLLNLAICIWYMLLTFQFKSRLVFNTRLVIRKTTLARATRLNIHATDTYLKLNISGGMV